MIHPANLTAAVVQYRQRRQAAEARDTAAPQDDRQTQSAATAK